MSDMQTTVWMLAALAALFGLLWLAILMDNRQKRQSLRYSADSLRVLIAQAQTWVETKPTSKEAEDNLKRVQQILAVIDDGLKRGTHPLTMLRSICNEPGCELAIAARFKAMADKKL